MPIEDKIKYLKDLKEECKTNSKKYYNAYKRLKWKDDVIDILTSLLNATSIALMISGLTFPPILIGAISCSGIAYVITQVQRSYNLKYRYTLHDITHKQYLDTIKKIDEVLTKNGLTGEQYEYFIQNMNEKCSLIDDARIIA